MLLQELRSLLCLIFVTSSLTSTSIPRMLEIFTMLIYFFTTKDVFKTSLRNFEFLSSLATKILQCSDFDSVFFLSFLYYRCSLVCFTSPVALYLASSLSVFWCHELMQRQQSISSLCLFVFRSSSSKYEIRFKLHLYSRQTNISKFSYIEGICHLPEVNQP